MGYRGHRLAKKSAALNLLAGGTAGYDPTAGTITSAAGTGTTFTRSTTATYHDPNNTSVVYSVASGKPRVLAGLGYLSENAATNICLQSAAFNTTWTVFGSGGGATVPVVAADQATAPDGTLTADQLAFGDTSAAASYSVITQSITLTAATYTASVWLRAAAPVTVYLSLANNSLYYTLACSVTTTWKRFTVSGLASALVWSLEIGGDRRDAGQVAVTSPTVFAWGAQVEASKFATSYIPTTTVAVTRAADSLSIATPAAWPKASGKIQLKFTPIWLNTVPTNARLITSTNAGVNGTQALIFPQSGSGTISWYVGATSQVSSDSAPQLWNPGQTYQLGFTWGAGNRATYRDGVFLAGITNGTAEMPTSSNTTVDFGAAAGGGQNADGWLSDIVVKAT